MAPAMDDMRLGDGVRLDGLLDNTLALKKAIENGYPLRILDGIAFAEPASVATDKGDAEFNQKLEEIVTEMKSDGTLKKLSLKWYDLDVTKSE